MTNDDFDMSLITLRELLAGADYLKVNDSITIDMSKEMKEDIEKMSNRNEIIKGIIFMNEDCIPLGLNFVGYDEGRKMFRTQVFYYNPRKDLFKK